MWRDIGETAATAIPRLDPETTEQMDPQRRHRASSHASAAQRYPHPRAAGAPPFPGPETPAAHVRPTDPGLVMYRSGDWTPEVLLHQLSGAHTVRCGHRVILSLEFLGRYSPLDPELVMMENADHAPDATIAVTGATGRLGGRVARRLAVAGVPQTLVVRDPARAPELPGATAVRGPFGDADAVRRALRGVNRVLMVSASETPDRVDQHRAFVDAAADACVGHLVYISFAGASPGSTFTLARDHAATEEHIRASGLAWTFLRDNLYADFVAAMVGDDGVIRGPAGEGRAAAVAQDDVADAAAAVLVGAPEHAGATYELTGPEALTLHEVAALLSRHTDRTVTYQPQTVEEAYASRASYGAPGWQLDAWVSTYLAIAGGELATLTDAVPTLTGHAATSLADLLSRQASAY
jgi:NAD(P)H dehydrogenase (quinone)